MTLLLYGVEAVALVVLVAVRRFGLVANEPLPDADGDPRAGVALGSSLRPERVDGEGQRAGLANRVHGELPHVLDSPGAQSVHLRDLVDADGRLVEHSVHARGPVAIRRDLGHESRRGRPRAPDG